MLERIPKENDQKPKKWDLEEGIGERTRKAREDKEKTRQAKHEFWRIGFGDYSGYLINSFKFEIRNDEEKIMGMEEVLINNIEKIMDAKNLDNDPSPVVMVDFGGMYSLSTLRIAAELEKRGLISNSKVVLVVTNLEFTPEHGLETAGEGYNDITEEEIKLVKKYKHLVHYIKADAAELAHKKVTLPNGSEMNLHDNIDILHENSALWHGTKNDADLPNLARQMTPYGMFFLGSGELHKQHKEDEEEYKIRKKAHLLGKKNMLLEGLTQVDLGKNSNYELYLARRAPKFEIPNE